MTAHSNRHFDPAVISAFTEVLGDILAIMSVYREDNGLMFRRPE